MTFTRSSIRLLAALLAIAPLRAVLAQDDQETLDGEWEIFLGTASDGRGALAPNVSS
jgi:hypothetical protein